VLSSEIRRRSIPIHLDAGTERPEGRTGFRHKHLLAYVHQERPNLVKAAVILVRAWQAAGKPRGVRTLGMFESWAEVIGGILDVAQVRGFLSNLRELEAPDTESAEWARFFSRWWSEYRDDVVGVASLYPLLEGDDNDDPIDLALDTGHHRDESAQRMVLGRRLAERRSRIIGGFRLVDAGTAQRAQQWRLERVDQQGEGEDATH
jgi:hypothetical protein